MSEEEGECKGMRIHPDCVYDSLTRGGFDEEACPRDDGHFDGVSDVFLEIVVAELSGKFEDTGIGAGPDGPGCGECADEVEDAATAVAEDADSEEFAEGGAGCGERAICEVVLVANEVDPV